MTRRRRFAYDDDMLKRTCPACGVSRLLEGPFYDRRRLTCLNCGGKFKLKKSSAKSVDGKKVKK